MRDLAAILMFVTVLPAFPGPTKPINPNFLLRKQGNAVTWSMNIDNSNSYTACLYTTTFFCRGNSLDSMAADLVLQCAKVFTINFEDGGAKESGTSNLVQRQASDMQRSDPGQTICCLRPLQQGVLLCAFSCYISMLLVFEIRIIHDFILSQAHF